MSENNFSIQDTFNELDNILSKLDNRDTSLEEAFKQYERGVSLVKRCNEVLNDTEKKILILQGESQKTADKDEF